LPGGDRAERRPGPARRQRGGHRHGAAPRGLRPSRNRRPAPAVGSSGGPSRGRRGGACRAPPPSRPLRETQEGSTAVKPFYGTEFIEGDRTIDLISIGMVGEDGTEDRKSGVEGEDAVEG